MASRRLWMCLLLASMGIVAGSPVCFGQGIDLGGIVAPAAPAAPSGTTTSTGSSGTSGSTGATGIGGSSANSAQQVQAVKLNIVATSSGTGTATGVPSTNNTFVSSYGDPLSMGLPSKFLTGAPAKPTATFGTGIYTTTTNIGAGTPAKTQATQAAGFNTNGIPRAPLYSTVLADDFPIKIHSSSALHSDVRAVIDRSSYLKNKSAIQVNINGNTVALSGQVGTEKERRMVEAMVRMSPGVVDVQNALVVQTK